MRRVVGPDSVVVDLGSGPGLFALLACRLGARRVYAIEPDGAIQIAREAYGSIEKALKEAAELSEKYSDS